MDANQTTPCWSSLKRLFFRFMFAYLLLYILPFPFRGIPFLENLSLWKRIVPWVGERVFYVTSTYHVSGSGDTTYHYVQVFCYLVVAVAAAIIWTLLDSQRSCYTRLLGWLKVYVRFYLAVAMVQYGAFKVIKTQFPEPSPSRLLQSIGDMSPMGLVWTFMGASQSYTVFTGAAEMLGGLLLIARRTTLLGALICAGVMSNVVMLNFSYDVPVKLFSLHLLAMSLLVAASDLRRLANMFVFNRGVEPVELPRLFEKPWLHRAALVLRTVVIVGVAGLTVFSSWQAGKAYRDPASKLPLYGIWKVDQFKIAGEDRPPLLTDSVRWRHVIFDHAGTMIIQSMSDSRKYYLLDLDSNKKLLALTTPDDPSWKSDISYRQPEPGLLELEGMFDGRTTWASLRRIDESNFLLINRGFHWINEYPFNR